MKKMRAIIGIVPVVSTPLTKEEKIDVPGLKRLIDFLMTKRIGGLWVLGTGSEDMNLTFAKRIQVAQTISEANAGKIPLVLGAGFFAMEEILEFIKETSSLKIDAFHVMPYHPLLSLDRLDWFYRRIADKSPKPLWMYTSANWSRPVSPEFIRRLKDCPNIAGIKFSTRDAVAITDVVGLAGDGFQVITAVASQLYACMGVGSKGHTSSLASCLPEIFIHIYELFQAGRHDQSLSEQHRLNSFLDELSKSTKGDNFLQAADEKYILSLRGICNEYVTSYYRNIKDEEKVRVKHLLEKYSFY